MSEQLTTNEARLLAKWMGLTKNIALLSFEELWQIPNEDGHTDHQLLDWLYTSPGQEKLMDELVHDGWMFSLWKPMNSPSSGYKVDLSKKETRFQANAQNRKDAFLKAMIKLITWKNNKFKE